MGAKGLTIGVFDSGFGGLTVLRELLPLVAGAHCVYLGDTARLPYGSKSRETIVRYALSSARFLQQRGAQLLVVACNTATALALDELRAGLTIPVVGVIEPGAEAAAAACREQSPQRAKTARRGPRQVTGEW
jgi:glutamate racemase